MLITAQFKADLFQLKHTANPESLLASLKDQAAIQLGRAIIEQFPFIKNEGKSFKGELPAMSMNRDHQFNDHYESRVYVISEQDYEVLMAAIENKQKQ